MKKIQHAGSLLLCLFVALAGCAKVPARETGDTASAPTVGNKAPGSQSGTGGPITIRLMDFGSPITDAVISAYQAKYSNERIDLVKPDMSPGKTTDVITKELVAQGKVDVVRVVDTPELVKAGALQTLDPFIQLYGFDLKPYGSVPQQLRSDGKLYELPAELQGRFLMYNTDLFKAAGETIPKDGWTWERFRTTAAKVTGGQGNNKVWGFAGAVDEYLAQAYLADRMGGLTEVPSEAQMKETMQFFSTMIWTDKSMAPAKEHTWPQRNFSLNNVEFETGKAAMTAEDLPAIQMVGKSLSNRNVHWGVAPIPSSDGKGTLTNLSVVTYGIAATTKQADAAWRFLSFLTGPEGAAISARFGQVPVYHSPDVKRAWFEQKPTPSPDSEFFFTTDWKLDPQDSGAIGGVWVPMNNAFNRMMSGKQPWEGAVDQYLQEVAQAGSKRP